MFWYFRTHIPQLIYQSGASIYKLLRQRITKRSGFHLYSYLPPFLSPALLFPLSPLVIGCRVNISLPADQYLEIQSPNYPNFYQDNEDCRWIVRAPTGHTLSVSIVDFITEENYDVLSFGTGSNPADSGSKVLEMSGMMSETVEEFINLNHMWVTFRSDSDKVERGFSLEIRDVGFQGKILFSYFLLRLVVWCPDW